MKVLVTGGTGFLGVECARQLRAGGHEVITADKRGSPDIALDLADGTALDRLPPVDAIVHSAAVQYVSTDLPFFGRDAYFFRNNIVATRNLAHRYSGTPAHFINIGSSMMYEQSGLDVYDVGSPMRPQGVYTASKIKALAYVDRMPNPTATVIPCIIAGEGRGGLFASLVQSMQRWHTAVCPGRGTHKVHVVHVRDAASLIVRVVERQATGRFNVASAEPLSLLEWIDQMAAELGVGRLRRLHLPLTPIELTSAALRYRLLAREQLLMLRHRHVLGVEESLALGWAPAYTNAQIVRETARTLMKPLSGSS